MVKLLLSLYGLYGPRRYIPAVFSLVRKRLFFRHLYQLTLNAADQAFHTLSNTSGLSDLYSGDPAQDALRIQNGARKLLSYQAGDETADFDIKMRWEANRGHHLPVLAMAGQLYDLPDKQVFEKTNAMEVAIAAINVVEADKILSVQKTDELKAFFKNSLLYIFSHSEKGAFFSTNHYFFNVLGALWIIENIERDKHLQQVKEQLYSELYGLLEQLFNTDGSLYEGSTYYHKYVTDSLLLFMALNPIDQHIRKKILPFLTRMYAFCCYASCGQTLCGLGDNDSGRILPLPDYFDYSCTDMRLTHQLARLLKIKLPQEQQLKRLRELNSSGEECAFGLIVLRNARWSVFVRCEQSAKPNLRLDVGSHCHNDQMSLTVFHMDIPILIDIGVYSYVEHDLCRLYNLKTAAHNTIVVGRLEQDQISNDWHYTPRRTMVKILNTGEYAVTGEYRAVDDYRHKRSVRLEEDMITIDDEICYEGAETPIRLLFYLAPDIKAHVCKDRTVHIDAGQRSFMMEIEGTNSLCVEEAVCFPEYGMKVPCLKVVGYLQLKNNHCQISTTIRVCNS